MKVKFKFTSSPRKLSTGKLTAMVEFEAGTDRHDLLDLELSENTVMSNEEVIGEHKPDMTIDEMLSKLRSDWLGIYAIMKTICKPNKAISFVACSGCSRKRTTMTRP